MVDSTTYKTFQLNQFKLGFIGKHISRNIDLIYRGTRDGMTCTSIHSMCKGHNPTMVLVKSHCSRVFGVYINQPVKPWTQGKFDEVCNDAFMFSLDTMEIMKMNRLVKTHLRFTDSIMLGFNGGSKGSDLIIRNYCDKS